VKSVLRTYKKWLNDEKVVFMKRYFIIVIIALLVTLSWSLWSRAKINREFSGLWTKYQDLWGDYEQELDHPGGTLVTLRIAVSEFDSYIGAQQFVLAFDKPLTISSNAWELYKDAYFSVLIPPGYKYFHEREDEVGVSSESGEPPYSLVYWSYKEEDGSGYALYADVIPNSGQTPTQIMNESLDAAGLPDTEGYDVRVSGQEATLFIDSFDGRRDSLWFETPQYLYELSIKYFPPDEPDPNLRSNREKEEEQQEYFKTFIHSFTFQ
jgi:hypothetical protein